MGGGPECEVKAVARVDCVRVIVTADILLGTSGMLASLSCAESCWMGSGSSSGALCICSANKSSSSSIGRITCARSRFPSKGLRSGLSQKAAGAIRVATPPSHSLVSGFRVFWKIYQCSLAKTSG